ncbi:hypothetical protein FAK_25010 [Desulfoferula mesophila]|uniref:Uncharacterized protein n=2 Tax=Desulfoferula mesophila TaxID=3058419 RepID=A0AAU9EF82_9BACT|nr:hypothetical protein FAK_25010 [Desulfoferula mesophilus]
MMFKPEALDALDGGDVRLQAFSDFLAAKGHDPHDTQGSGCMCGVNNGRWDQGLVNTSMQDAQRAPITFRMDRLDVEMFTREGKAQGRPFFLKASKIASCLNSGLNKGGHRRFDHSSGMVATPGTLEPGENLLGCMCLLPEDRGKSGYVKLKVDYTPLIAAAILPGPGASQQTGSGKSDLKQIVNIGPLEKGEARYFLLQAPAGATATLTLAPAQGLALFTADKWRPMQSEWKAGNLTGAGPLLIMVRALADKAQGALQLALSWNGSKIQIPAKPAPARLVSAGKPASRVFKAYMLGMGNSSVKKSSFDPGIKSPCCSGEPR